MKKTAKRGMALLMALVVCLSLLPAIQLKANAADVEYVYSGSYIYNWGTREEEATFLSPNAEAFYTGNNTYAYFSTLAGSADVDCVPSSELYLSLQSFMTQKHQTITSYDGTRSLYQYTDCQNSAKTSTKISSFYSGVEIGPEWDSGSTWNREHTWPDSKGSGLAEYDIMMLRPTSVSENSSRGNTAYGKSSGFYHPNSESNGVYDLRGDVARIMLYVYVRWGNTSYMWGSSGVMESLDVLLKWMEADPVDTWELGRNDSVESITGTRNVFVDYPELAFLLFGAEIPSEMTTPSGEAARGACDHNYEEAGRTEADCTEDGYITYTCSVCLRSKMELYQEALGHDYGDGTACVRCGNEKPAERPYLAKFDFPGASTTGHKDGSEMKTETAVYTDGDYTLTFTDYSKIYVNAQDAQNNGCIKFGSSSSVGTLTFTVPKDVHSVVLYLAGYKANTGKYSVNGGNTITLTKFSNNGEYDEVQVDTTTNKTISVATKSGGVRMMMCSIIYYGCNHNYEGVITPPSCTAGGYTTYTCTVCGDSYTDEETEATGHTYVDYVCACGQARAFSLVTDASTLRPGDTIIIAASDSAVAMGALTSNNCNETAITKVDTTAIYNENLLLITLVEGTETGTFGFRVTTSDGAVYLREPASSTGLKNSSTLDANGSWKISADANGVATIVSQGVGNCHYLRCRNGGFACYSSASTGSNVSIYVLPVEWVTTEEELMAALADGSTTDVVLGGNITTSETVTVLADQTLNLNGYTLTAGNLVSFGQVVDCNLDGVDGLGGICSAGQVQLQPSNPCLPIYDNSSSCYRLYYHDYVFLGQKEEGNAIKYGITIKFDNLQAYQLIKNGGSLLKVQFVLSINDGASHYYMDYTQGGLASWAENAEKYYSNATNTSEWAMTMRVTGFETLPEGTTFSMGAILKSEAIVGYMEAK